MTFCNKSTWIVTIIIHYKVCRHKANHGTVGQSDSGSVTIPYLHILFILLHLTPHTSVAMSPTDEVYLSRTCEAAAPDERRRYPRLAEGCGVVLTLLGLITLLLAAAGFILERDVQASGGGFLAGSLALGSGVSGCLISSRFYSRRNCYLHLAVVVVSTSAIAVLEALVLLHLIARRIELKRTNFAWEFLPFTVSYNERVDKTVTIKNG